MRNLKERRELALSWDNEGGPDLSGSRDVLLLRPVRSGVLPLANTELAQLRIRVIALEDAVVSLLAQNSDQQLDRVLDVAAYITPRPGFIPHPRALRAAAEWVHLVERARHFRGSGDSVSAPDP